MGRRSKNKQGDPAPFANVKAYSAQPSPEKLGKRKVVGTEADIEGSRLQKKAKTAKKKAKTKEVEGYGNERSRLSSGKQTVDHDMKGEDESESEGWEDVDDSLDLKVQAK
jgi:hypothetical protein